MDPKLTSSGQVPYLATNSTNAAFATVAGRTVTAPTAASVFSLGANQGAKYRGVRITFFGVGTAGTSGNWRVWSLKQGAAFLNGSTTDYTRQLVAHGTATLGAGTGALSSGHPLTTEKMCDQLTCVADLWGTGAAAANNGVAPFVITCAAGGEATLVINDLDDTWAIEVEFEKGTTTSLNCLIERVV